MVQHPFSKYVGSNSWHFQQEKKESKTVNWKATYELAYWKQVFIFIFLLENNLMGNGSYWEILLTSLFLLHLSVWFPTINSWSPFWGIQSGEWGGKGTPSFLWMYIAVYLFVQVFHSWQVSSARRRTGCSKRGAALGWKPSGTSVKSGNFVTAFMEKTTAWI